MINGGNIFVAVHCEIVTRVDTESVSQIGDILNGKRNFVALTVAVRIVLFERS